MPSVSPRILQLYSVHASDPVDRSRWSRKWTRPRESHTPTYAAEALSNRRSSSIPTEGYRRTFSCMEEWPSKFAGNAAGQPREGVAVLRGDSDVAGLEPDHYALTAVEHRERDGGVHVHVLAARCDVETAGA